MCSARSSLNTMPSTAPAPEMVCVRFPAILAIPYSSAIMIGRGDDVYR
ncbi:hypothetical protein SGGMMB4_02939 [Sodalis glossinidius str. 'morsitans']|uniref:Uncharacterized protein n=1 Tax=Sodalis glossinidius (strain morsitans) TaxID=343509 RepID=A0A193QJN4_SODGM|nr:hypothetical protein SGGMMB4_02939 [Sodalis glossinidius str. 'morsitans']